ncbi:MAG: type III-B CRISPR module RAMP protein Cmr1 [Candidatus Diapherotrites archaeon]|nr:type III-B CRISPR module RAMP protein Cmr1 [Candidatus Diapherotrites archaeon]
MKQQSKDTICQVRHYKLITPLFGGGAEPHKPDAVTVVRGSEIRGLLRFWWRATAGGRFSNLNVMREIEGKIWGTAAGIGAGYSQVKLHVTLTHGGKPFQATDRKGHPVNNIGNVKSIYSYVAFPLRDVPNAKVWDGIEFDLEICFPKSFAEDIEAALWAWETFGGIGARTRRGFGALQLVTINGKTVPLASPHEIRALIKQRLEQLTSTDQRQTGFPRLYSNCPLVITKPSKDAIDAWRALFDRYKRFRQARYPDAKGRPFGRSQWPEPDAIRRITGRASPGHEPIHPVQNKFPRGQFGLPIIFQFKEKDEANGDPPKTTLEGREQDRFASRLIFRPLACQGGAVGLACILGGPANPPDGYVLKEQTSGAVLEHPSVTLSLQDAKQIPPLHGEPDVLKAFLKTLGWKE